jgi:hypothetical protein
MASTKNQPPKRSSGARRKKSRKATWRRASKIEVVMN